MNLKNIHIEFKKTIKSCEKFSCLARAKEFQIQSCRDLQELKDKIIAIKQVAIKNKNETSSNRLLYYQLVTQTLIHELEMWIAFKNDDPSNAWDRLVEAQSSLSGAVRAFDVKETLDPYIEKLHLLEELLFPKMVFASLGINPLKSTCSICKSNYDKCEHIKNKPYKGELCHVNIEESVLEEISLVPNPANKHCRIMTITDTHGIRRDHITWKEINDDT